MPRGYVELEETLLFLRVIPRNRSFRGLQRPGRRVMAPIPAATFKPVLPSILSGCSDIVRFEPPMSTLARAPTPTVALPVAGKVPGERTSRHICSRREDCPHQDAGLRVANVNAELRDCSVIMLGATRPGRKRQCSAFEEPKTKPQPLATLQL